MSVEEVAEVVGRSRDSVAWDMRLAKAWLRRELTEGSTGE
jgi:hypothetical protein